MNIVYIAIGFIVGFSLATILSKWFIDGFMSGVRKTFPDRSKYPNRPQDETVVMKDPKE